VTSSRARCSRRSASRCAPGRRRAGRSASPPVGEEVGYSLRVPAADPLVGRARVTDVKVLPGNVRVSFSFVNQNDDEKERVEMFVFDTVLAQLQG
jgi:hypothetical protein